ncbi:hypothetical protein MTBBW1_600009 [Desulfamplus magnetovallimortis]|uniref:Uncharacterized protein n=1 Tax=Desulfamplus magnetovallimortis TaxID=1246637 RepID=A0A1W1HI76_9BACT|nr:hypothetical protein MTBBW1_600009 [Desulfamplus magnetovallimortis]
MATGTAIPIKIVGIMINRGMVLIKKYQYVVVPGMDFILIKNGTQNEDIAMDILIHPNTMRVLSGFILGNDIKKLPKEIPTRKIANIIVNE